MAAPPKPYDALSLMFECVKHGGIEMCAFYFVAGSIVRGVGRRYEPSERGVWIYPECTMIEDNEGRTHRGEKAIMCVASQQNSIQWPAQILQIKPKHSIECQCQAHQSLYASARIAKLIGTHPGEQDES